MTAWLSVLPRWLVVGVALAAAFTLVAAVLFSLGDRLFPGPEQAPGPTAEDRRRAEIRAYLDALGERYAEDHPVAGQSVAFYLPARDVAITFDARAYFRIEGTGTDPVLVEHELPGAALGYRLPFETPDPAPANDGPTAGDDGPAAGNGGPSTGNGGPAAGPSGRGDPPAIETAFAELGLPDDPDLSEVKSAYRRQVKRVHPDQGGDPEEFRRVREAYTVAKDAVR